MTIEVRIDYKQRGFVENFQHPWQSKSLQVNIIKSGLQAFDVPSRKPPEIFILLKFHVRPNKFLHTAELPTSLKVSENSQSSIECSQLSEASIISRF